MAGQETNRVTIEICPPNGKSAQVILTMARPRRKGEGNHVDCPWITTNLVEDPRNPGQTRRNSHYMSMWDLYENNLEQKIKNWLRRNGLRRETSNAKLILEKIAQLREKAGVL
jgi:hypothetical protein